MSLRINREAPDFTPVCTTEPGYMAGPQPEFQKRNCKIIGLSVDLVTNHIEWVMDIEETQGHKVNYPMISDPELKIAGLYGMLPAEAGNTSGGRTAADNATVRTIFVVGPDKKIKLMISYPMSTGRNFDEVLRVVASLRLTARRKVATPVNWRPPENMENQFNKTVLAVVNDIFFSSKIDGAAKHAGVTLKYVTIEKDLLERAKADPALIIFDLNFEAVHPIKLIRKLKGTDELKHISLLGYVSHVQTDLQRLAQEAGCDAVMPRSAFSKNLSQILMRHAGAGARQPS